MKGKIFYLPVIIIFLLGCGEMKKSDEIIYIEMPEKQLTFSTKNHALDNNDNFSPDGKYLCYDTRATVYNENLANCKSIEKVEIATGTETVLWEPPNITGENAAPGVAAASFHPKENKVIFIHGPFLDEVEERGYYDIRNRNGIEIDSEGNGKITKVDLRDVKNASTIHGAHRGGTHRHEYTRNGNRIGFTYDDFILQNYDRTIGYMEKNRKGPKGHSHFFSLILKPAEKEKSKPGEIEKAFGDSWIDSYGTMRAFIGKVRSENGIDYKYDLFVADIPSEVNITTSFSGNQDEYPTPPKGINIRRLTYGMEVTGIVRGSYNGEMIAFAAKDENGINQLFIIGAEGPQKEPIKVTNLENDVEYIRWHSSDHWIIYVSGGNIFASSINPTIFGKTVQFTNDEKKRTQLVVSQDGNTFAYNIKTETRDIETKLVKDAAGNDFMQIFIMNVDWSKIIL